MRAELEMTNAETFPISGTGLHDLVQFQSSEIIGELKEPVDHALANMKRLNDRFAEIVARISDDSPESHRLLADSLHLIDETTLGLTLISQITSQLGPDAASQVIPWQKVDLNSVIMLTVTSMDDQLSEACEVDLNLTDLPEVECDAGAIQWVLESIIFFLNQHIGSPGGHITVAAQRLGQFVMISAEENKSGLSQDIMSSLMIANEDLLECSTIIEHHNGQLDVYSSPNDGTCFELMLPLG